MLEEGTYEATIASAQKKESKAGNDMITVLLEIEHGGEKHKAWDHLVYTPGSEWKFDAVRDSIGFPVGVKLDPMNMLDRVVRVKVTTESSKEYGDQLRVKWLKSEAPDVQEPSTNDKEDDDDDEPNI